MNATAEFRQPFYLPYDDVNRAGALCAKLKGIIGCIQGAATSSETPEPSAIVNACWCADDLVKELIGIVEMRQPQQTAQPAAGA